eukprot:m.1137616 g.1137616  ORF g.1137616 m.1137616 type:complete len:1373 (-) comp24436_c0_seq1:65-4183(-)
MTTRFSGFRSLAADFERHLEVTDHPDRGGIGNAVAFLALRKYVLRPERATCMQTISENTEQNGASDEIRSILVACADELRSHSQGKKSRIQQTMRMQAYYLDKYESYYASVIRRKTQLASEYKGFLAGIDAPDDPPTSEVLVHGQQILQRIKQFALARMTPLLPPTTGDANDSTGGDTTTIGNFVNTVPLPEKFLEAVLPTTEAWSALAADDSDASRTVDERMGVLQRVIEAAGGRLLLDAYQNGTGADAGHLWLRVEAKGIALSAALSERILCVLRTITMLTTALCGEHHHLDAWRKTHAHPGRAALLNLLQFHVYLNGLQRAVLDSGTRSEAARSELQAFFAATSSETLASDRDTATCRKCLTLAESLAFDYHFLAHVEQVLADLDTFLLVEGPDAGNLGMDALFQGLDLALDATADRGADAVGTVVGQRRDHTRVLFQSANAVRRRRSSRIILGPKTTTGSVSRRRSSGGSTGAVGGGLLTQAVQNADVPIVLQADHVAGAPGGEHGVPELHPYGQRLKECPYDDIPIAINGLCVVSAARAGGVVRLANPALGLIRYGGLHYGVASIESAQAFVSAPDNYLRNLCDRAMENGDVFELFRMSRYLPELSIVRKEIGMTGQIGDVLNAMNDPLAERTGDVYAWGCRAIANFANVSKINRDELVGNPTTVTSVLRALNSSVCSADTMEAVCSAILATAQTEDVADAYFEGNAAVIILQTLLPLQHEERAQSRAFKALALLSRHSNHAQSIADGSGAAVITEILRAPEQAPDVLPHVLEVVKNCAHEIPLIRKQFVALGLLDVLYELFDTQATNAPCLRWVCEALERLCVSEDIRTQVCADNGHWRVLDMFSRHKSHALAMQGACQLLARLSQDLATALDVISRGGMMLVMGVLSYHKRDIECQLYACWALLELAGGEADAADLKDLAQHRTLSTNDPAAEDTTSNRRDVVESIIHSMVHHTAVADVQRYGCKALENFGARSEAQRAQIAKSNAVQVMLKGGKAHAANAKVQDALLHALACIAGQDETMHYHMAQMSVLPYAVASLTQLAAVPTVAASGCRLIANLLQHGEVLGLARKYHVSDTVTAALGTHKDDATVVHYSMWALVHLCSDNKQRMAYVDTLKPTVLAAVAAHHADPDVQKVGCELMTKLSLNVNEQPQLAERVIKHTLQALKEHSREVDVVISVVTALNTLAANPKNRDAVGNYGGIELLVPLLKQHAHSAHLLQMGCTLLGTVSFKSAKNKACIGRVGGVQVVVGALDEHLFVTGVVVGAAGFLRNYATADAQRTDVVRKQALPALRRALLEHAQDEAVFFWVSAALNNICRDLTARNIVRNLNGVVRTAQGAMEFFELGSAAHSSAVELCERLASDKRK